VDDSEEPRRGSRALAALGFDPNTVLAREPGVLLDPSFLGAMHAELTKYSGSQFDPQCVDGFLHLLDREHLRAIALGVTTNHRDDRTQDQELGSVACRNL
jgi:hypothetical protein